MNTDKGISEWTQGWLFPELEPHMNTLEVVGHADSFEEWATEQPDIDARIFKDAQMFYTVMAMFDFEADRRGWRLDEIRFQRKEDGRVLSIMKASKGSRKVVAFVGGQSFYDTWREVQETKRREGFEWKPDKWAK